MSGGAGRPAPDGAPRVGPVLYVASRYPVLSETFVHREVDALRAGGVVVPVATLRPPPDDAANRALAARAGATVPVYGAGSGALAAAALAECAAHPLRAVRTLCAALGDMLSADDVSLRGRAVVPAQAVAGLALARRARPLAVRHVHAHMANAPTTVAMYASMQLGVPFSFTGHANDLFVGRGLLREKLRRAAFVACISEWNRGFFQSVAGPRPVRAPIVRCGVDVPAEPAGRAETGVTRVVAVGRLVPKKGFSVLVEATALLQARGAHVELEIVGDGPERGALGSRIAALPRPGGVRLSGALPHEEALARIRGADLFVLPCIVDRTGDRDGIPVVLMEAMAAGVAVVSGDLPPIRELVTDGETGRMVPPGDAAALADAIAHLASDPRERRRLGAAGRARVAEEFSTPVNLRRLVDAFAATEGAR